MFNKKIRQIAYPLLISNQCLIFVCISNYSNSKCTLFLYDFAYLNIEKSEKNTILYMAFL